MAVRDAFGRDAIIISNRSTDDGIEILATDNFDDLQKDHQVAESPHSEAPVQNLANKNKQRPSAVVSPGYAEPDVAAIRETQLRREIADLQGAVQGLAATGRAASGKNWAEVTLAGRLMGLGLSSTYVQQLIEQSRPITKMDTAWERTIKKIQRQMPTAPGDYTTEGGVYVFHGPAGSGKTTTVCKLAAQFLTENTVGKLAVISAGHNATLARGDGLLKSFCQVLRIPLHHAETTSDLRQILNGLRRKKLVLVDTPAFDVNALLPFAESTNQAKRKAEHCLVVSACSQGSLLDHTFACLAESAVESLVVTQTDQTRQIGTVIDSMLGTGFKLRYCSNTADLHSRLRHNAVEVLIDQLAQVNPASLSSLDSVISGTFDSGSVANWLEPAILV